VRKVSPSDAAAAAFSKDDPFGGASQRAIAQFYNVTSNRELRAVRANQLRLLLDEQGYTDKGQNSGKYGLPIEYSKSVFSLFIMDSGRERPDADAGGVFDTPVLSFADRRRLPTTVWSLMPNDDHTAI
jgi:hypothetical protein